MKKLLCVLLSLCILCQLGVVSAFATEAATETTEVVLLDCDFEDGIVGNSISTSADTALAWSSRTDSGERMMYYYVDDVDTARGQVACFGMESTTSRGPRLTKKLYFGDTLKNLKVSYKARRGGTSLSMSVRYSDDTDQGIYAVTSEAWTQVEAVFDFEALTCMVYENGEYKKTVTLSENDTSTLQVYFSASISTGRSAYLDDVRISTTDDVDLESVSNGAAPARTHEEIMAEFADLAYAPAITVPDGVYTQFTYDCSLNANNGISTGTDALFTGISNATQAVLNASSENNGKLIRMTNSRVITQNGSLSKKLLVGTYPGTVTAEYYTYLGNSATYLQLRAADKTTELASFANYPISAATTGAVANDWNKIKAVFDIKNDLCSLYVNDTPVAENIAFTSEFAADAYEAYVYIYGKLANADTILFDNFVMYQDAEPEVSGLKYYGTTGTSWDMVEADVVLEDSSFVYNMNAHPRMMINDPAELTNKIASDARVKAWADSIVTAADKAVADEPYAYEYGNGRNILSTARNIGSRMEYLGFAYLVTQNDTYVKRGIEEMRNAALFPDWSNQAPIIPSEIMLGFSFFYDWCYNSPVMTDEVKKELIQIIFDQALWQFARSYDRVISAEIRTGSSNRTTVSNSAAICTAIAIADEYPAIAQFLIDNALVCMMPSINAYGSDGAYPEGATYWGYPMRTLTPALDSILTAAKEDYTLPEDAQWYFNNETLKNTLDYWMYMAGPISCFDYGDASFGYTFAPSIFWTAQRNGQDFHGWYLDYLMDKEGSGISRMHFASLWYEPDYTWSNEALPLDKTFNASDKAQVASMRSSWTSEDALFGAIQGGYNGTGHMFKSLGTFVIEANGQRFITTAGRSNYSALYSGYMYYGERAEGQNTIIANPPSDTWDQNATAYARFIAHEEAENEAFTVLDMTQTNNAFSDAKRGMYITPGRRSIVLQDEITTITPSEIWWFAHTESDIELAEDGKSAMLYQNGERMYVRITSGPEEAVFTVMKAAPLPTSPVAPDETYSNSEKLAIHLEDISTLSLTVEFIPLVAKEAAPSAYTPVKPIAEWAVSDNYVSVNRQAGHRLVMLTGSPNALAMENKELIDPYDTHVVPFVKDGVVYVPAQFSGESVHAKVTVNDTAVSLKRRSVTTTITENLFVKNGTTYVPATALAEALDMQLYTDEDGLIAFSDCAISFTEAEHAAICKQLGTRVLLSGRDFVGFDVDKTAYELRYEESVPVVTLADGTAVTRDGNTSTFTLDGTTYTITFVQDAFKDAIRNIVLGNIPTPSQTMGNSYTIDKMTDGSKSTSAATISTSLSSATFVFDFGGGYTIDHIELCDLQAETGSSMEKATWYGGVFDENGDWVWTELGVNEDLTQGYLNGEKRSNELTVADGVVYDGLKVTMEDTDGVKARYYIYELGVYGYEQRMDLYPYMITDCAVADGDAVFTTQLWDVAADGYYVVALYNEGKQVAVRIQPYTAFAEKMTATFEDVEFDEAKVMLLESFFTMRILTEPETIPNV